MLSLKERIDVLVELGHYLQLKDERLHAYLHRTAHKNKWFSVEYQEFAIDAICQQFLNRDLLEKWVEKNQIINNQQPQKMAIIPSDSTPLSGFHDLLCTFITGNISVFKLSEKDLFTLPFLVKKMDEIKSGTAAYFSFPETLPIREINGILATGNEGIIKQFNLYFKNKKRLLRLQKNSIGIIQGDETKEDFRKLAIDVLTYFGMGSRNISKIYVPENYDFDLFLQVFHEFKDIIKNSVFKNNYDYQITVLILNRIKHWNNGSIILAEKEAIASPVSVLNFETYKDSNNLYSKIKEAAFNLENIISNTALKEIHSTPYGKSLIPALDDYENNLDIIKFLQKI